MVKCNKTLKPRDTNKLCRKPIKFCTKKLFEKHINYIFFFNLIMLTVQKKANHTSKKSELNSWIGVGSLL